MDILLQYNDIIDYYLRDDVLSFLFKLSQTRKLKFFHHCHSDPRNRIRSEPEGISFHCIKSKDELRERILKVTECIPVYQYEFFPFWGMQSTQVNAPGYPDEIIGWDMRYEFDFDQKCSFDAVLPMAGILEYFRVPYLLKYSGHRSLHLIIPAEAFPLQMKNTVNHKRWMDVFDLLGDFFCRITPYLNHTGAGLSKETVLSTPYSFHRYNGLISIPLKIKNALDFDLSQAHLINAQEAVWMLPATNDQGMALDSLIKFAENVQMHPDTAVERIPEAFVGDEWVHFFSYTVPNGIDPYSITGILMAGICGLRQEKCITSISHQLLKAILSIDDPKNKSIKRLRLVGEIGFNVPFEIIVMNRLLNAEILSKWVQDGCNPALEHILGIMCDTRYSFPFLLALRLCTLLPEDPVSLIGNLLNLWHKQQDGRGLNRLFFTLAVGQLGAGISDIPDANGKDTEIVETSNMRQVEQSWFVDDDPDKTLAVLCVAYGLDTVQSWASEPDASESQLVIQNAFGGNMKKFQYAIQRMLYRR